MMTNEELLTRLPAYVSGTLAPEKSRELEEYLAHRPSLRQYLASLNIHVAHYDQQLAEESTAPPPYSRQASTTRDPSHSDAAAAEAVGAIVKLLQIPEEPSPPPAPSILSPTGWKYATVASTIAFIVVCFAAGQFLLAMRQLASELNLMQRQVSILEAQSGQMGSAAPIGSNPIPISPINLAQGQVQAIAPPEASPGQHKLELSPVADLGNGQAYFLVDAEHNLLVLAGLQPLPDGRVYQLWFQNQSGDTTFVAPLPLAVRGPTLIDIYLPIGIYDYTAIGISSASLTEITQIGDILFQASPTAP
ncbi:MAG: hypothetical protein R2911_40705 [Caldilineaceae bacterium]